MEQNSHRYNEGNNPNQKEPSNAERTDQPFNNKKKKTQQPSATHKLTRMGQKQICTTTVTKKVIN